MDIRASLDAACDPDVLFDRVGSLDSYDEWLDIVPRTERAAPADGDRADGDRAGGDRVGGDGPAWMVTLRGRIGPLARSKRLRMVRTVHEPPTRAVFERRETDGREHAAWVLTAEVEPTSAGSRLLMHLHYDGVLWVPLLDRLLAGEIERSRGRLQRLVET